jgi:Protein of unknown function (DUF732)
MRAKFVFSAMVAGAALATALAAPANADDTDSIFISVLDDEGITYPSTSEAVTMAHGVCVHLSEGNSLEATATQLSKETGLEIEPAGFFVGAATAAYCPQHSPS